MNSRKAVATNWKDLEREDVREGVRRSGFGTENVLIVLNECTPGMAGNPHTHEFDQIAYIESGRGTYHIGEVAHPIEPGSILLIPAGEVHEIVPEGDEVVRNIDIFTPLRGDLAHLLDWMSEA